MFTGLVQSLAKVEAILPDGPGVRLTITDLFAVPGAAVGDSIAINGCCLTVVAVQGNSLTFEAGSETLKRTTLGELSEGDPINLETALGAGDALGGHLVSGHVDGLGTIDQRIEDSDWCTLWVKVPNGLTRQMASKGSVAMDGVSLTLVDVEKERFSVALIPHTLNVTTLGQRQPGDRVNLETDILAKYVEQQLRWKS
ncbi:MAG: riboflavin synthase [Pirellulales bacterium]|nr:riboflavin synthase [Pirellulales bacterium]